MIISPVFFFTEMNCVFISTFNWIWKYAYHFSIYLWFEFYCDLNIIRLLTPPIFISFSSVISVNNRFDCRWFFWLLLHFLLWLFDFHHLFFFFDRLLGQWCIFWWVSFFLLQLILFHLVFKLLWAFFWKPFVMLLLESFKYSHQLRYIMSY